jgi:hypothetical protein
VEAFADTVRPKGGKNSATSPVSFELAGGVEAQRKDAKTLLANATKRSLPDGKESPAAKMLEDLQKPGGKRIVVRVTALGIVNNTHMEPDGTILMEFNPWGKGTLRQGKGYVPAPENEVSLVHEFAHAYRLATKTVSTNAFFEEAFATRMENWARISLGLKQVTSYTGYFGALGKQTIPVKPHPGY